MKTTIVATAVPRTASVLAPCPSADVARVRRDVIPAGVVVAFLAPTTGYVRPHPGLLLELSQP